MNRFEKTYIECLEQAMKDHPEEYWWSDKMVIHGNTADTVVPKSNAEAVAHNMFKAIRNRSFNKDGRAFKATCKKLGIPFTYKAIYSAFEEAENEA
jgi:hypothetical protein